MQKIKITGKINTVNNQKKTKRRNTNVIKTEILTTVKREPHLIKSVFCLATSNTSDSIENKQGVNSLYLSYNTNRLYTLK